MRNPNSPLAEFIDAFLAARKTALADYTLRDYQRYLRAFDDFTRHDTLRRALTLKNAELWREHMKERGESTSRNGAMALKSFATWLSRSGNLVGPGGGTVLVGLGSPSPSRAPKRRPITDPELLRVWASLGQISQDRERAVAYLRLLHTTGLRKNDVRVLKTADLTVDPAGNAAWLIATAKTPGGKPKHRRIRLDRTTLEAIQQYLTKRPRYAGRPPELLFLTRQGRGYTTWGWSTWSDKLFEELYRTTGWKGSADSFRATWKQEAEAQIRDRDLRRRCADLLAAERDHDRAVREACLVLEDRVRGRSGADASLYGTTLMEWAFAPGRVALATNPAEQTGVMQLYRGTIAFYRNGTGHRVRADFDPTEALRVVTWIDHLLGLLDR